MEFCGPAGPVGTGTSGPRHILVYPMTRDRKKAKMS